MAGKIINMIQEIEIAYDKTSLIVKISVIERRPWISSPNSIAFELGGR